MPDLSTLPPELIGPFAIVFALALLVSKIFDLIEKWRKIAPSKSTSTNSDVLINKPLSSLSKKEVFIYSFIGAISISTFTIIVNYIFIDAQEYLESQLFNFGYNLFFGFVSAIICTFFISNKFALINQNVVVPLLMGFAVVAVISLPVGLIASIYQINKMFG